MSVTAFTTSPAKLLEKIRKAIDEKHIDTWSYDGDGHFTHSVPQWKNQAWFYPVVGPDTLQFGLIGVEGVTMTKTVYGIYHGRFIEELLTHFDQDFTTITATALGNKPLDRFKARPANA